MSLKLISPVFFLFKKIWLLANLKLHIGAGIIFLLDGATLGPCVSNAGCSVLVGSEIGVVGQKSVFKNWNGME